jgi:hypothetical protein
MNHNNPGSEFEFQWVEDSLKYTGHVFIYGLAGLANVLGYMCEVAAAAAKEATRK